MDSLIFDIQRFSIHDGKGIRTVVFFKGCNLHCPWCQNPESIDSRPEIAFYSDKCFKGGGCVKACAEGAINIGAENHIDRDKCTRCGNCVDACVSNALKLIGKRMSVDQVMEELIKDKAYYETSGGGITFSGGEPSLHANFILPILKQCQQQGIHTNIETNGYFNWDKFAMLLPYLDQIFFDLKIIDQKRNKDILGGDSQRIIKNIDLLLKNDAPVEFRIPLIPGYTTDDKNLKAVLKLLQEKGISKVHMLPYHSMGESKADRICSDLPKLNEKPFNTEQLDSFRNMFEKENIEIELYR